MGREFLLGTMKSLEIVVMVVQHCNVLNGHRINCTFKNDKMGGTWVAQSPAEDPDRHVC